MEPDTIHKRASELMADGWVRGRVAELAASVERELTIEVANLLREAGRIVFSDIRKITKDNGTLLLPHELDTDTDTAAAIKSFEIDKDGAVKYQFWDKNSAMERLFKHKGQFELDNKQKTDPLEALLGALKGNVVGPAG